ncbi:MAG: biosynthetic-type acetolactate synthase large subunit [Clostridiaceae bacterium]
MKGSELILDCLEKEGVDSVFAYPGGSVIPLFDALYDNKNIKVYRPCHEQGGSHACDGYARATGKPGVLIVTSGPGVTNAITGIATAYLDSVPMVVITGQVGKNLLGKTSFQEVDTTGITMPITKHNIQVTDANQIQEAIKLAFQVAKNGRPGPVVVDVTKNAFMDEAEYKEYTPSTYLKDKRSAEYLDQIKLAARTLRNSKNPVIYAGGGVLKAKASERLRRLAEVCNIPVTNSIMGLGSFNRKSPLSYGIVGMHGDKETNLLVYNADCVLGLGVRFSDRAIGHRKGFSPDAKIIQVDTDETEFGKNVDVDIQILGDMNDVLDLLYEELKDVRFEDKHYATKTQEIEEGFLPAVVLDTVQEHFPEGTIVATDVGQHQMWTVRNWMFTDPDTLLTSGGLGTMGFGLGAAIGAKVGMPNKKVVLITGDGSFRMNQNELLTARKYNLDLTIVLFNNHTLGMVRQWQNVFNEKRYSDTDLYDSLDLPTLCKAYGVNYTGNFHDKASLKELLASNDVMTGINILEFQLDHDVNVTPMVAAGKAINDMIEKI